MQTFAKLPRQAPNIKIKNEFKKIKGLKYYVDAKLITPW